MQNNGLYIFHLIFSFFQHLLQRIVEKGLKKNLFFNWIAFFSIHGSSLYLKKVDRFAPLMHNIYFWWTPLFRTLITLRMRVDLQPMLNESSRSTHMNVTATILSVTSGLHLLQHIQSASSFLAGKWFIRPFPTQLIQSITEPSGGGLWQVYL